MANERAILCGAVPVGSLPFGGDDPLQLHLWGPAENIKLQINDIRSHLLQDIPSRFHDLVEIATYVYVADQATTRGGDGVDVFGENWRRKLFFRIPVRSPGFWNQEEVLAQLIDMLSFLSEDEYFFDFIKLAGKPPSQLHLEFGGDAPEEVILFSGGLDSLGGAIQEAVVAQRRVALVTHKSTQKLARRHRKLEQLLAKHTAHAPLHIPVVINKNKGLGREYTQRSRSFLYAALAATVAEMFGLSRIRFYENGVVSFNLPVSAQVVGARATRTTHPQVINGFAELLSLVAAKRFAVENPFLWKTKAEVIKVITAAKCEEMIKFATSCSHTWEMTKLRTHCGTCSQCIDRRFAVLAAKAEAHDPAESYGVDLLTGERTEGEPRTMLASYVEMANDVAEMSALGFFGRYGEASRILKHLNGSPDTTALQLFELHRRHAKCVTDVVDNAIAQHRKAIRKRLLPGSCLLRLVCDSSLAAAGAPVSHQPRSVEALPDNFMRLKGEYWAIRFGGNEERIYKPDIGFHYLRVLLQNPGTTFSASKLDCHVRRRIKGTIGAALGVADDFSPDNSIILGDLEGEDVIGPEYEQSLRAYLEEIDEMIAAARESGDLAQVDKIDELEKQKLMIKSMLSKAKGLGGRNRRLGDERNKVRNRVGNAIRRTLKKVEQYDKPLSEHLQRPVLNLGHTVSYIPRSDLTWSTPPIEKT
ncbi:MAG: 7-cyano-7-deazaguanine synthase [Planctomycetes bacterium]|nr:7-cyano-7-deazaguanine synthase [Planctomycetota bacterium]